MSDFEIHIGYVNSFDFNDKMSEEMLQGHPKKGRVYQLIKDEKYGYRLHIGAENTKDNLMEGILLGDELIGEHDERWHFNIEIINKENFLEFDLQPDDSEKIQVWFSNDNKDLRETLQKPTKIVAQDKNGDLIGKDENPSVEDIVEQTYVSNVTHALNAIMDHDKKGFIILSRLILYLASRYVPQYYEQTGIDPITMLLNAKSSDISVYGVLDALQAYTSKDDPDYMNVGKIYEAIDYLMLELQRKENNG